MCVSRKTTGIYGCMPDRAGCRLHKHVTWCSVVRACCCSWLTSLLRWQCKGLTDLKCLGARVQGGAGNEGWRVRLHAVEVCTVYMGIASLRLVVYWLHCAGNRILAPFGNRTITQIVYVRAPHQSAMRVKRCRAPLIRFRAKCSVQRAPAAIARTLLGAVPL